MITRREKRNITIFVLGVFVGIALSAIVVYFSVIASFTKDNIIKITNIFPSDSVQVISKIPAEEKRNLNSKDSSSKANLLKDQEDSLPKKDVIKSDVKIAEEVIPIVSINDSSEHVITAIIKEMRVEQWESPMNFVGYKLSHNSLIIYGIDLSNIELQYIDGSICLIVGEKRLILQETDNFVRFPLSFFK